MYPLHHLASAFISPAVHGFANVCDNRLSKEFPTNVTLLAAVSVALQCLLLLPLLLFFPLDFHFSAAIWAQIVAITLLDFFYLYPYYWSLKHTDTSVVAALFSLGKITVPVLAWFFLNETLAPSQYLGFFLIIGSGLMLTFHWGRMHLNAAAMLMLGVSLMLAVCGLLEKNTLNTGVDWFSLLVITMWLKLALGVGLMSLRAAENIATLRHLRLKTGKWMLAEALLSTTGNAGGMLALSLLPITVTRGISSSQPLFIATYAALFGKKWPGLFQENESGLPAWRKMLAFALIIVGTVLSLRP